MSKQVFSQTNEYNPGTAKLNYRINSSGSEVTLNGMLLLPLVSVEMENPYTVKITGVTLRPTYDLYASVIYYTGSTKLGTYAFNNESKFITFSAGAYELNLYNSSYPNADRVRLQLGIVGTTAITAEDLTDLYVEFTPKTVNETVTVWQSTGLAFVPADYESRIISLENAVPNIQSESGSKVTIPSFGNNAVSECITKIKALQVGINRK